MHFERADNFTYCREIPAIGVLLAILPWSRRFHLFDLYECLLPITTSWLSLIKKKFSPESWSCIIHPKIHFNVIMQKVSKTRQVTTQANKQHILQDCSYISVSRVMLNMKQNVTPSVKMEWLTIFLWGEGGGVKMIFSMVNCNLMLCNTFLLKMPNIWDQNSKCFY